MLVKFIWMFSLVNERLSTRSSSADKIANVNFFATASYTHYKIQQTRAYIPPQIDAVMCWNACLPNWVKKRNVTAITPFKVIQETDFGTNRKLIIRLPISDYLISCTVFKLWLIIRQVFATERECLTLTLSLNVIPCQYNHKWYITKKTTFFGLHFGREVSVYRQPLLRNLSRNLSNAVKLRRR